MSSYYRSSAPSTWGTSNYRFAQPPEPPFRPQPTCEPHYILTHQQYSHPHLNDTQGGGLDFYQAHSMNPDPMLYHRIREGIYDTEGVGLNEARYWHRQAYGGFGDVRSLTARDMGHAAAYEAYRMWIHNRSISDLRSDPGQRREAFIALAIAEVSHIFPSGQLHHERRKFREACETAAATASTIFHTLDDDWYSGGGSQISSSPFGRAGSTSSDDFSDDVYAYDEQVMPRRSHRHHRRRSSSVSFNSRPMIIPPNPNYQSSPGIPIPMNQPTYSYSGGSPYQTGGSPYSNPVPFNGPGSYPQYQGGLQVPAPGSSYDPNQTLAYQGPGSYPQQTYIQTQPGMAQSVPMAPGSAIIIHQPSHKSSHSHRSKRHHKHRSSSRDNRRHRSASDAYYYQ